MMLKFNNLVKHIGKEISKVEKILEEPHLIYTNYETILSLHKVIKELVSDLPNRTDEYIQIQFNKFRMSCEEDIKQLDDITKKYIGDNINIKVQYKPITLTIFPKSLFDDIYKLIDPNVTAEDLNNPTKRKMIDNYYKNVQVVCSEYKELRSQLSNYIKFINNTKRDLHKLYVIHLHYIKGQLEHNKSLYEKYKINSKPIQWCKQTEFLNRYLDNQY